MNEYIGGGGFYIYKYINNNKRIIILLLIYLYIKVVDCLLARGVCQLLLETIEPFFWTYLFLGIETSAKLLAFAARLRKKSRYFFSVLLILLTFDPEILFVSSKRYTLSWLILNKQSSCLIFRFRTLIFLSVFFLHLYPPKTSKNLCVKRHEYGWKHRRVKKNSYE